MPSSNGHHEKKLSGYLPLIDTLRTYRLSHLRADLPAAATVALFAIPQAMAYALVAGVPPVHGLYAAIVACILGAAVGSSPFLIDGPTNAISVMLASNLAIYAGGSDPVAVLVVLTVVTGLIQIGMGALRLGGVTRFVSTPVLHGFAAGAGLYIVANQLHALLGFPMRPEPPVLGGMQFAPTCLMRVISTILALDQTNLVALALGGGTFLVIRVLRAIERRTGKRIPSTLVGIVAATAISEYLGLGTAAAGAYRVAVVSDMEPITRALPTLHMPDFTLVAPTNLLGPAMAIAVLGAIEAIAIARTLADRSGQNFDPNQQLLGEGVANLGTGLFSGVTSSGSFTRSAVNFEAGARTRMSGVLAGVLVLVLLLLLAPLANRIPITALAGSLVHVATILVNVGKIRLSLFTTRADRWGLLITFSLVLVLSHLEQALLLGIAFSVGMALRRAHSVELHRLVQDAECGFREEPLGLPDPAERVVVIDASGEMFFAAVDTFESLLRPFTVGQDRVVILRMRNAMNMDATLCEALHRLGSAMKNSGSRLVLSGVPAGTMGTLQRAGLVALLGKDAIYPVESGVYRATRHALQDAQRG